MLRWAASSAGSIQVGPEVELEPSSPAVSRRQGLTSLNELVPGPAGKDSGWAGQGHPGPLLISGPDSRLSKSGLKKCKGLVS